MYTLSTVHSLHKVGVSGVLMTANEYVEQSGDAAEPASAAQ